MKFQMDQAIRVSWREREAQTTPPTPGTAAVERQNRILRDLTDRSVIAGSYFRRPASSWEVNAEEWPHYVRYNVVCQ